MKIKGLKKFPIQITLDQETKHPTCGAVNDSSWYDVAQALTEYHTKHKNLLMGAKIAFSFVLTKDGIKTFWKPGGNSNGE